MTALEYRAYHAWDASTRWFHWINALAVIGLIATGVVVLNDDALGLSTDGKILLKGIHVSELPGNARVPPTVCDGARNNLLRVDRSDRSSHHRRGHHRAS